MPQRSQFCFFAAIECHKDLSKARLLLVQVSLSLPPSPLPSLSAAAAVIQGTCALVREHVQLLGLFCVTRVLCVCVCVCVCIYLSMHITLTIRIQLLGVVCVTRK